MSRTYRRRKEQVPNWCYDHNAVEVDGEVYVVLCGEYIRPQRQRERHARSRDELLTIQYNHYHSENYTGLCSAPGFFRRIIERKYRMHVAKQIRKGLVDDLDVVVDKRMSNAAYNWW